MLFVYVLLYFIIHTYLVRPTLQPLGLQNGGFGHAEEFIELSQACSLWLAMFFLGKLSSQKVASFFSLKFSCTLNTVYMYYTYAGGVN